MRRQTKGGRGHARKGLKVNARYPANCQALQTQRLLTKRLRPPPFFFFLRKGADNLESSRSD